MTAVTLASPVTTPDRVHVLDVLRGFALFGILLINHQPLLPTANTPWSGWDHPLAVLLEVFVEKKFYSLFSLLFGIGFAIFLRRADARGLESSTLIRRRLTGLLLIGVLHTIFLWFGDILVFYALVGFLLIPFRRCSDRTLIRSAVVVLLSPIPLYGLGAWLAGSVGLVGDSNDAPPPKVLLDALNAFTEGSYWEIVRTNLLFTAAGAVRRLASSMQIVRVLGMFLLGYWVGRTMLVDPLAVHATMLRRVVLVAFLVGLPASVAMGFLPSGDPLWPSFGGWPEAISATFAAPLLALGYASAIVLLYQKHAGRLFDIFAPVGRLALTNYLLQSLALFVVYYGTGLGLAGRVSLTTTTIISTLLFSIQIVASRWWLRRFDYGPAEWLWRQFTYRRRLPLRRARTDDSG